MTELHVAFSRANKQKIYVQDLLMENKESVWDAIRVSEINDMFQNKNREYRFLTYSVTNGDHF